MLQPGVCSHWPHQGQGEEQEELCYVPFPPFFKLFHFLICPLFFPQKPSMGVCLLPSPFL